jgi:HlyD family secretion protein
MVGTAPAPLRVVPEPKRPLTELIETEKRRRRRRLLASWLAAFLVPALAFAGFFAFRPRPVPLDARFRMQKVTRENVVREVHATGHVEAVTTVQVGAEISGRIASVEVDYNSQVKAGDVLARIDRSALDAQLAQARATLAASRASLEQAKTDREQAVRNAVRARQLHAAHIMSDGDYELAESNLRLAAQRISAALASIDAQQAAYDLTRTTRDRTLIRSPIDGIVITRHVDPGQTVAAAFQTPVLFTVAADLEKMRVIAAVDEADIGEVERGQTALFTVNAYPNRTFEGRVTEVRNSPVVVQDVVTYETVVEVENEGLALKPGMTASTRIRTASVDGALIVPNAALHFTPPNETGHEQAGVWRIEGGALRWSELTTGITDGEVTEVKGAAPLEGQNVLVDLTPAGRKAYGVGH